MRLRSIFAAVSFMEDIVIRQATLTDVSRIAEILVFVKRVKFRPIFQDDAYSFGELQVLPVAEQYAKLLDHILVYDDGGIVKGLIRIEENEIVELYVDVFFWNQGIGSALIEYAKAHYPVTFLWAIEKNTDSIRFYERHGFHLTDTKKFEEGTTEYLVMLTRGKRVELHTERLTLKPLGVQYLDTTAQYSLDPQNARYMCFLPHQDIEETQAFLESVEAEWNKEDPAFYEFAVLHEGKHIGAVSLYFENGLGELGWIIRKDHWGQGFATEAAQALITHFADQGCRHFIAHCDTQNPASARVMEKLGMTRTGTFGGRKNRNAAEESQEYQYELVK